MADGTNDLKIAMNDVMMVSSRESPVVQNVESHASSNLQREWQTSCGKAMGYEDPSVIEVVDGDGSSSSKSGSPGIFILNLMDEDDPSETELNTAATSTFTPIGSSQAQTARDHWMENANQIDASIHLMADMIVKNQRGYVTGDLTDEEASVLESTVLSFAATAANQIDSLRAAIPPTNSTTTQPSTSSDYAHFCSEIVAILLLRLRETVANPMQQLQKQRTRTATSIFQHPLACRLVVRTSNYEHDDPSMNVPSVWDQLDRDDSDNGRQQFLPRQEVPPNTASSTTGFMSAYTSKHVELVPKPPSLFPKRRRTTWHDDEGHYDGTMSSQQEQEQPPAKQAKISQETVSRIHEERMLYQQQQEEHVRVQEETQQEFQKEAVLLEASLQNDLDSVYQVEQRMTEITALLSQFSTLVSEQQEDIVNIHDTTLTSKANVSKGQESLVDAKERTKRSKHYMATLVFSVAVILLFFNYVTP